MSTRSRLPSRALLLGLWCLGGCVVDDCDSTPYDPAPGPGELGKGDFHYFCTSADDPACPDLYDTGPFPARFAVGGQFRLAYTWEDENSQPPPDLRPSSEERMKVVGEVFTPLVVGYTAVLAVVGDSDIGDLIHLLAREPSELRIQLDHVDLIELDLGIDEERTVKAIARDGEYILAGTLTYAFEVLDPAVATLSGTTPGSALLRGVAAGSTTLRASLGPLTVEVPVIVSDVAVTTGDLTTGGSETGSSGSGGSGGSSEGTSGGSGGSSEGTSGGSGGSSGGSSGSTGGVL